MINEGVEGTSALYSWDVEKAGEKKVKRRRSFLHTTLGVQVDVKKLSYWVATRKSYKKILKGITLHLEPGAMCALMGPSGSGKSTLLDVIANRKKEGLWRGEVLIDGKKRSHRFHRDIAYVLQSDLHISTLTVEETIMYSAWVRLPESTTLAERRERVSMLLHMMELTSIRHRTVGDQLHKGISGGQLKRLSIAVEMVALPNLIFLDEPSSGLDSAIALEVMSAVQRLAHSNHTCISTIHQPSPEIFALFDSLILLAQGYLVYCGPADEAVVHFTRPNLGYVMHPDANPAEFVLDVCSGELSPEGQDTPRAAPSLSFLFYESPYAVPSSPLQPSPRRNGCSDQESDTRAMYPTSFTTQFSMLLHRTSVASARDERELRALILKNIIIGILIAIVFYDQADISKPFFDDNGLLNSEATGMISLLFFSMMYCLMNNLQAIPTLCNKDVLYRRELECYAYSSGPYWLVSSIASLPTLILTHSIYIILVYFFCNFRTSVEYFFYYYILLLLTNVTSFYFAQFLAAATGNAELAFALFPITFLFLSMFAGFTIPVGKVPEGWSWAPMIDYARWVFEGLMSNEFEYYGDEGEAVLDEYDFKNFDKYDSFWIVAIMMGICLFGCYVAMLPSPSKLQYTTEESPPPPLSPGNISARNLWQKWVYMKNVSRALTTTLIGRKCSYHDDSGNHSDNEDDGDFSTVVLKDVEWYKTKTSTLPATRGCRLLFLGIHYTVRHRTDKNLRFTLLKNVTGRVIPGEMCALLGASGAGKSTLLDVLAGRKTTGEITGDILFNGSTRNEGMMANSAYVMQDNVHVAALTVAQTLYFAAQLRVSEAMSPQEKQLRVEKVMHMLGLEEVANTVVGGPNLRGCSGGQVKRLSIGVEIINLPDLIFLDEPTTGLDSARSYEVMAAVRNLANHYRTVLFTIHQPSVAIFSLFDKLILLSQGYVVYFGPARDVVHYFVSSPYNFHYIRGTNPADYCISIAAMHMQSHDRRYVPVTELVEYFDISELHQSLLQNAESLKSMDEAAALLAPHETPDHRMDHTQRKKYQTSTVHQLHCIVALFYGSIFWELSDTEYSERLAVFFFSLLFMVLGHQQAIPLMFEERLLFYRERSARAYGAISYCLSAWAIQLPLILLNVLFFSVILYFMCGFTDPDKHFGVFYLIMLLTSLTGFAFCQTVAAVSPSSQIAINYFPVSLFITIAFGGYIVYIPSFPYWLRVWAPYLSFVRYAFQALVLNELSGNSDLRNSDYIIDELGFDTIPRDDCIAYLLIFLGLFLGLVLGALHYINFEER